VAVVSQGKVVCTCFNVRDVTIAERLQSCTGTAAERLAQLQSALQCGTNCGSCEPELQRMVRSSAQPTVIPLAATPQGA
jgi:assimilatory nitrate reductase catalytic subunit